MSKPELDNQDDDPWADTRKRLDDIRRRPQHGRWAGVKDWLAIAAVILVLAFRFDRKPALQLRPVHHFRVQPLGRGAQAVGLTLDPRRLVS
jgi:hypothetical protein